MGVGTPSRRLLCVSLRGSGLKEASVGTASDVRSSLVYLLVWGFVFISARCRTAYETVKAGQRRLSEGRHASLSSSFSEIEFGRARPTSLLHSTIHLLIPSGEQRERERTRYRSGMKEGREEQRRRDEERWKEERGEEEGTARKGRHIYRPL